MNPDAMYEGIRLAAVADGMSEEEAEAYAASHTHLSTRETPFGSSGLLGLEPNNPTVPEPPSLEGALGFTWTDVLLEAQRAGELRPLIPGLLLPGLTLFSGPSRFGKSLMSLDMALGVATGSACFGGAVPNVYGDVLLISFEDSSPSIAARVTDYFGVREMIPDLSRLTFVPASIASKENPATLARRWLDSVANPTLIIIDTFQRMKAAFPGQRGYGNSYENDVAAVAPLHRFTQEHNVALLIVHHLKQGEWVEGQDYYEKVSGSTGLVATADTNLIVKWSRDARDAAMKVSPRIAESHEISLARVGMWWHIFDGVPRGNMGDRKRDLLDWIAMSGEVTPKQCAEHLGVDEKNASAYLSQLVKSGHVSRAGRGRYEFKATLVEVT
jgi:hypothetical protein